MTSSVRPDRYAQCHGDCTVDCGACKGNGRPVEPSEPPAEALAPWPYGDAVQPDIEDDEPPAETQQDDEVPLVGAADRATARRVVEEWRDRGHSTSVVGLDELRAGIAAALAARPSADTETLRDVLRTHHPIMCSETGPFSGCRCGQVQLGQDVIAHVVAQLAKALDGGR